MTSFGEITGVVKICSANAVVSSEKTVQTSVGEIAGVENLLRKTLLNPVPGEMREDLLQYHRYLRKWGQPSEPAKSIRTRTDMSPQRLEEEF